MVVVSDMAVSPADFVLEWTLRSAGDLRVELERLVPVPGQSGGHVWVRGERTGRAADRLREDPDVEEVTVLERTSEGTLVRVRWEGRPTLFSNLAAVEGTCLRAVVRERNWQCRARFPSRGSLATFYRSCLDDDVAVTIDTVHDGATPEETRGTRRLTDPQQETLARALEAGFFAVPRETTLGELADELGISDTAVSQRIRRGLEGVLREELPVRPGERRD